MIDDGADGAEADTEASDPSTFSPPTSTSHLVRPRRRAVAQPLRLDSSPPVVCYKYEQGRPSSAAAGGRWQGRRAHLHYYLPENWSPSYKFTVFEDSYILALPREAGPHAAAPAPSVAAPGAELRPLRAGAQPPAAPQPAAAPPLAALLGAPPRTPPPIQSLAPQSFEPPPPLAPPPSAACAFHLARPLHGAGGGRGGAPGAAEFEIVWPVEVDQALLDAVEAACDRVVPGAKRKPHAAISLNGVNLKLQRLEM